jgi:hypothetical protein
MKPTLLHVLSRPIVLVLAVLSSAPFLWAANDSPGLHYYYPVPPAKEPQVVEADVCVYGGTPGGVTAAVQAARMGKKTVLVVFGRHVGGMTSGGLTATDTGNEKAIGGMAMEFYHRVGKLRGFRPSEAEAAFRAMLKDAGVSIYFEHRLKDVTKDGNKITTLRAENGNAFKARVFVDASYEGDLLAAAGVSFHVGREDNAKYGEAHNGVFFGPFHNFNVKVDPYKVEGKADSGLLWGVSAAAPGKPGQGDAKVQAYNFRMWLTDAADRLPFPQPAGYDREHYALLLRYLKKQPKPVLPFQLARGDCNNSGGFSTDSNLPKLLGELVYALEYRGHEVKLPFDADGRTDLIVPKNLYIIATMNSSDRSIGHIDVAIRRRFGLYHLPPDANIVRKVWSRAGGASYGEQLAKLMGRLNGKLGAGTDPSAEAELGVGHSYFLPTSVPLGEAAKQLTQMKQQVQMKW